jgi:AcrR family transcriptional regulator
MSGGWLREQQPRHAEEKILAAAEKAFVEVGVSHAGMAEIAEAAGCSRGTLYRYFKSRHELHLAYVEWKGLAIAERVQAEIAGLEDPAERTAAAILGAVREVRANPGTAAWFAHGAAGMGTRMSQSARVIEKLAGAFGEFVPSRGNEGRLQGRWMVRVIVSLLANPGQDEAEERALVERFVVPSLLRPA